MKTADFDYHLPPERIAQTPAKPRDSSRLMVLHRNSRKIEHRHFFDIGEYLKPGDLLIMNESKVFKARLRTVDGVEIFLLRPLSSPSPENVPGSSWIALAKPGKKLRINSTITFPDGITAEVVEKHEDGTVTIRLEKSVEDVFAWVDRVGEIPTPPYVTTTPSNAADYQTVYAKTIGSVAAPTAGFHFTSELLEKLQRQGIQMATVTLHVGLGTFRPMKTETIEEHAMHEEWVDVSDETLRIIEQTHVRGDRVVAVGTTTVRALESGIQHGFTNVFITPGYRFKYVDALITNFHLPKSTLLVLVSAFAGNREFVLRAYQEAIEKEYRFYSFGDAMLIT